MYMHCNGLSVSDYIWRRINTYCARRKKNMVAVEYSLLPLLLVLEKWRAVDTQSFGGINRVKMRLFQTHRSGQLILVSTTEIIFIIIFTSEDGPALVVNA